MNQINFKSEQLATDTFFHQNVSSLARHLYVCRGRKGGYSQAYLIEAEQQLRENIFLRAQTAGG